MFTITPLVNRLFPARCELCGGMSDHTGCICQACTLDLPAIENGCIICGRTLRYNHTCGSCLTGPHRLHKTVTPFRYAYPIDRLIKKYKYNQNLVILAPLANALATKLLVGSDRLPEAMIPVPLHFIRAYSRGFNQSLEICRALQPRLRIPIDCKLMRRIKNTSPMYTLSADRRRQNVRKAFRLTGTCPYRSVAIVDDVITTGATGSELARLLLRAGAERVELWALARADI